MGQERTIRMDEISIEVILRDLLANAVFLVLIVLTAVMSVQIYHNLVYVPEYTSTATLAISAKGSSGNNAYASLATANSMADVFAEVFQSDVMKEKIEESAGELAEKAQITSELIPETNLLLLHVTAGNPDTAYTVIQAVLDNYHSVSDYLFGNAVIDIVMNPQVPIAPSNPVNLGRYEKMAALGAFCLTALLIAVSSVMRNTIKTVRAADRKIEGRCLGVICHEEKNRTWRAKLKKINKGLLITNPVSSFPFEEAYHQLASRVDYQMQKENAKVLLVNSVAENEGKSTVAANLALALSNRNKLVVLMDMDFRKPALYKLFDMPADMPDTLMDFLKGESEKLPLVVHDKRRGILELFNRKVESSSRNVLKSKRLEMLIEVQKTQADYIILDSPPISVGVDAEILTDLADASILVVRQDYVWIPDLNDAIETLRQGKSVFLGYVLNDFEHNALGGQYGRYGTYGKHNHRTEETKEKETSKHRQERKEDHGRI